MYKKLISTVETNTEIFQLQKKSFLKLLKEFKDVLQDVKYNRPEKTLSKHKERGKLLARERINLLIDPSTPFLEFSELGAYDQYNNEFPSAGIITGIGLIHGHETIIVANDATVKGGTYVKETIKKHIRAQEIALQNHLPCVYLVDSGGVFLPKQTDVFPDRFDFGRIFYYQSKISAEGIPQVAVVMGSCTAGGAYIPAMSDETIIVKDQGTIFIGGPPLVKAATGEEVSAEELGGGMVHASISGVADHLAEDDVDALEKCRNIFISYGKPKSFPIDIENIEQPQFKAEELYGIIPIDLKKKFNSYEVIMRITDGSRFNEFKENYGKTLICGYAHIMGIHVGILANNGFLSSESALKGAHFVEICNHRKIPILFLQNTTGFIVGKKYEHQGIARDGAKFIHAVSNTVVPKITLVIGGSYGAGNYAMAGRAFDPNFLFMWPNAKIAVMGGQQAENVLKALNSTKNDTENSLEEQFERESTSYFSTSRIWDDGIIDPIDTRKVLALAFSVSLKNEIPEPKYGIFRM